MGGTPGKAAIVAAADHAAPCWKLGTPVAAALEAEMAGSLAPGARCDTGRA